MCGEFVVGVKAVLVPWEGRSSVIEVWPRACRRSVVRVLDKCGSFCVMMMMMMREWCWRRWLFRKSCSCEFTVAWRHLPYIWVL